jgi:dephospho-CoA kinase
MELTEEVQSEILDYLKSRFAVHEIEYMANNNIGQFNYIINEVTNN